MVLFPEVQANAQNEIDEVIGTKRLPVMEDRPNLPYINRVIQELLRWCPTLYNGASLARDPAYIGLIS